MAATIQELIKKGFSIHFKGLSPAFKQKVEIIAYHFGSLDSFLSAKKEDFEDITFICHFLQYNRYHIGGKLRLLFPTNIT
jgi:hypothetical protein